MQTQIIISFISIGGAAAAALACDFLRAKNSQLRKQVDRMLSERGQKHTSRGIAAERVPTGMHSPSELAELAARHEPFTGLAISIAVSAKNPREVALVEQFLCGLLRNKDFGCRVNRHEFALLCPGLGSAEARRHLAHLSEQLWDYQLRALSKSPLVFNVGGIDVQGESLSDAIASATLRMNQTRRNPKMGFVPQPQRAV